MSVLAAIWTPRLQPLAPITKTKGWRNQIEREIHTARVRSRSPRRKGGVKQYLKEWAQGHLSAACLWRLCYSIVGVDKTDAGYGIHRLADMASEVQGSERNCMYKLRKILADTVLVDLVHEVPHDKKDKTNTLTHHLRPSLLAGLIHKYNRRKFGVIFGADPAGIKGFWESFFGSEDGREFKSLHPSLRDKDPEALKNSIPIVIHEDAAPYGKKKSVMCFQWGPLITHGTDLESRFMAHCYIKNNCSADTATKGWSLFWEEVDCMAEGRDHNGNYFAQDTDGTIWKFEFLFCQNDFDMDPEHGLPNYKMGKLFCKYCRATNCADKGFGSNPFPHQDQKSTASWRRTLVTDNDEFMNRLVRPHPLTQSKYFNKYTVRNDLMHALDHKGVYGVQIASTLVYLLDNDGVPSLGRTKGERLETINARLHDFNKGPNLNATSKLDALTESNLQPHGAKDYATLAGPTVKAANTRQSLPFLKYIADRYLTDESNIDHVLIHLLIRHTLEFNRVMYSAGTFFTDAEIHELTNATLGVGKYMQLLRARAKEAGSLLWHITPKTHYMQHFPAEAKLISPKAVQCYIEESYIGKIAQVWASCKNGPVKETIQATALLKYLIWLAIELDL